MPIFRKLVRGIKKRFIGKGLFFLKHSASVEEPYIQECEEKIRNGAANSLISFNEDSPIRGHEAIQSELDRQGIKPAEIHDISDIDKVSVRLKDLPTAFALVYRDFQVNRGLKKALTELQQNDLITEPLSTTEPDTGLWDQLNEYAREKWGILKIGFTKVPRQLIFRDKHILFPYAVVFIEEMRKSKIDKAPLAPAGGEAIRVYARLGNAVNGIARWLRKKGIRCQPQHPMGGLTMTPPLAAKAGLGWQGKQGLLITPEFGVRQRIAPIFIESPLFEFTDSLEHQWVEDYCGTCGLCAKRCPGNAILDERLVIASNVEGLGQIRKCTDMMKCFEQFDLYYGCSVCVKVCPFSQGPGSYERIKSNFEKRK